MIRNRRTHRLFEGRDSFGSKSSFKAFKTSQGRSGNGWRRIENLEDNRFDIASDTEGGVRKVIQDYFDKGYSSEDIAFHFKTAFKQAYDFYSDVLIKAHRTTPGFYQVEVYYDRGIVVRIQIDDEDYEEYQSSWKRRDPGDFRVKWVHEDEYHIKYMTYKVAASDIPSAPKFNTLYTVVFRALVLDNWAAPKTYPDNAKEIYDDILKQIPVEF